MAEIKQPRLLNADEIETRVKMWDKVNHGWAMILLYKNARCDMRILDEMYGVDGWQREHQEIGGRLYCTISVWSEKLGQWIKKQDVGVESDTEKEKGHASDAFKRAAYNLGIGRELYTAPKIYIKTTEADYKGGSFSTTLDVTKVEYNEKREIVALQLVDDNGLVRFRWPASNGKAPAQSREQAKNEDPDLDLAIDDIKRCKTMAQLQDVCNRWKCYRGYERFESAGKQRQTEIQQNS